MKKILLSCVTCLLALGLVTACDNEDEIADSGETTTEDSGTGSGGSGTTEAVTLENYSLSFTFMVGDTEDTIPEGATIYISYGPKGQAWGDFIALDDSNSVTFTTIATGTYEYKLVIYDGEDAVSWSNCAEITTSNQSFVVSEEDDGGQSITITSTSTLAEILATLAQASPYDDYYSLVGDFEDASWNGWPARTSKYYLGYDPEDVTTMYWEVTVTIAEAPDFGEYSPWDAGLRVAEVTYNEETQQDDWTTIVGYSNLATGSTGVGNSAGSDNNIPVTWGATYNLVIDCTTSGSESILVALVTEGSEAE